MINKMIDATPGNEIPKLIDQADHLFKEQKFEDSKKIFEQLVAMDPGNPKIIVGLLRCMIQLKLYDESKELFESTNAITGMFSLFASLTAILSFNIYMLIDNIFFYNFMIWLYTQSWFLRKMSISVNYLYRVFRELS